MIAFLHGIVRGVTPTSVYLDVNGVGFEVGMSSRALARLPLTGDPADVFTYLQVRDDGMSLFGFLTVIASAIIVPVMPYMLSFAAGAMICVVVEELIPEMSAGGRSNTGVMWFAFGFTLMMALDVALG